jgi:hypothetical protein
VQCVMNTPPVLEILIQIKKESKNVCPNKFSSFTQQKNILVTICINIVIKAECFEFNAKLSIRHDLRTQSLTTDGI